MDKETERYYTDAIMERPYCFSVDDLRFYIYPVTLGKSLLIQRLISSLGINYEQLLSNASLEMLRVVKMGRETCLRIIAYSCCKNKCDVFDEACIKHIIGIFRDGMTDEEITTLMLTILTGDKTDEVISAFGMDKEADMMRSAMKAKDTSGTLTFGGNSIYGTTIDVLCQRYGWTLDYVVWGISYANIRLLLADYIKEVHMTDEERKRLPANVLHKDEEVIMGTKDNMDTIRSMDWR